MIENLILRNLALEYPDKLKMAIKSNIKKDSSFPSDSSGYQIQYFRLR